MRDRAAALCLCAALGLTACGGGGAERSILGRASGIPEGQVLLTVDGVEVPAWEHLYWLALACDRTASAYRSAGQVPDWEDGTLARLVEDEALADTVLYTEAGILADRYGVSLTGADEDALGRRWTRRCEAHGGEEAYLAVLSGYGLDEDRALTLWRTARRYAALWGQCRAGGAPSPDEDTLAALERTSGQIRFDRILIAERSGGQGRAEHVFSMLNAAKDPASLFAELASGSDDPAGPRSLDGSGLDGELAGIVRSLEIGQMSGIVSSAEGWSILRRLPPDRDALLEAWLDQALETAADSAEIALSERYGQIDAGAFARALTELRDGSAPS